MSFRECIDAAVHDGVIESGDGEELKRRYAAELRAAYGDAAKAKDSLAAKLAAEGAERKRRSLLAAQASKQIGADVKGFRGPDGRPDVVSAVSRLFEHVGHTGYSSVRGRFNALYGSALSEIGDALHAFGRGALDPRRKNAAVLDDVARAAFGEAADPKAQALYDAWMRPSEKLRQLFNEAGGRIGWRKDWGLPQSHDDGAVLHAGFDRWHDFIERRLDWDKMRHPASDTPILLEDRRDVLDHVWRSIVMDGWNTREPSAAEAGRPSLANARNDARFLTFKDSAGWLDYNRQFGRGNTFDVLVNHLRGLAKDVALMQRLGPNPGATVQWLKQVIEQEGTRALVGDESTFRFGGMRKLLSKSGAAEMSGAIKHGSSLVDALYETARGSGTPRTTLDQTYTIAANLQMSAKLGSAVLVHALINPLQEANLRLHYGVPLAPMMRDIARNFAGASAREIDQSGMILADAMHSLEGNAREAGALSRTARWSQWLPFATTHYSGLEAGVTALRRSWWWGASSAITNELDKGFADVNPRLRTLLDGFGIDDRDWAVMQAAKLYEPGRNAAFLRWQEIRDAGIDNAEAVASAFGHDHTTDEGSVATARDAERTAMKYLELLHQSMEAAVPSSRWRSRVFLTGGTREGTAANVLFKSAAMFKGFIGSATMTNIEAMRRELSRNKVVGASAAGANLIALGLLGTAVQQLKQMSNGKDLLSMDPGTREGRNTWFHGLLTSGALSVFGDFLASDRSSYGHGALETLAGPVVTGAIDVAQPAVDAVMDHTHHREKTAAEQRSDTVQGALRVLRNNTPVLSTHWALRAAYNRILLDQLQFLLDPRAHQAMRKTEDRVRKDTGQRFWWRPGAPAPERFPQMARPGR